MIARAVRALLPGAALLLLFAVELPAQDGAAEAVWLELSVDEENLRATPNGTRIGVLRRGVRLRQVGEEGRWHEVVLTGYLPGDRIRTSDRQGPGHAVATGGEDVVDAPAGRVVGRAEGGMLVEALEEEEGWRQIRRTAWIWGGSVEPAPAPEATAEAPSVESVGDGEEAAPDAEAASAAGSSTVVLLDGPRGDTVAIIRNPARLRVVDAEGDWRLVRAEGWTLADVEDAAGGGDASPGAVRETPDRFRNAPVSWTVEFLALQRADPLRTDFESGEWYILARNPEGVPGLVYLVVDEAARDVARGLVPLQRLTIRGRLRTGRSAQTGHPVVVVQSLRP